MSDNCNHNCDTCSKDCSDNVITKEPLHPKSKIKKVYGILSGKGGVGKSSITIMIANELSKNGKRVGILDADITGPSIAHAYNILDKAKGNSEGIYPEFTKNNIQVMSMNMLLRNDTDPTVWRGPILGGVIKQFWSDVIWDDLDYLLIDMPPGTSDVALSVFQSLKIDGIIIVTTPQSLVGMIANKAINMAKLMQINIVGLVENMSYYKCDKCQSIHKIFGESSAEEIAKDNNIDTIIRLPINPDIASKIDSRKADLLEGEDFKDLISKL